MSKTTEPHTGPKRLVPTLQSKGALGKSHFMALLIEYYLYAGIPFRAVDSDAVHQTLKRRYKEHTGQFDATLNQDAFGQLIAAVPDSPVVLWDFRANFTPVFSSMRNITAAIGAGTQRIARHVADLHER